MIETVRAVSGEWETRCDRVCKKNFYSQFTFVLYSVYTSSFTIPRSTIINGINKNNSIFFFPILDGVSVFILPIDISCSEIN